MWKKSVSTLLVFLFTVSPAQLLMAMNPDDRIIDYHKHVKNDSDDNGIEYIRMHDSDEEQSGVETNKYDEEHKYIKIGQGDRFIKVDYFLPESSALVRVPALVFAGLFEGTHRVTQGGLVALHLVLYAYGFDVKPKTIYQIVKYSAVGVAAATVAVLTVRERFKDFQITAQMQNGTLESVINNSQRSSIDVHAGLRVGYDPQIPEIPGWQDLPNITIPVPNLNISIPLPPIPTTPVVTPIPQQTPTIFSIPVVPPLPTLPPLAPLPNSASLPPEVAEEIQRILQTALDQTAQNVNNVLQAANQQGRDYVLALQDSFPDSGIDAAFDISIPTVNNDMSSNTEFGINNQTAFLGSIDVGKFVRTIIPDEAAEGLIVYVCGLGIFLMAERQVLSFIKWEERPRPWEQWGRAKASELFTSNKPNEEEAAKWKKRLFYTEWLRVPGILLAYAGSMAVIGALIGQEMNKINNLSLTYNHSSYADYGNTSTSNFAVSTENNFSLGEFAAYISGSKTSDISASSVFRSVMLIGSVGLNDIPHTNLLLSLGIGFIILGFIDGLMHKFVAYKFESASGSSAR